MKYKINVTTANGKKTSLTVPAGYTFDQVCEAANSQAARFNAKATISCDGEFIFACDYRSDAAIVSVSALA
jgi:hypothetical protein